MDGHSSILGWMTLQHTPCFDLFFSAGLHTGFVVLFVGPKIGCPHHYLVFSMDIKYHLSFCFHPILGITLVHQFDQRYGNLPGKIHHLMALYCIYDLDVIIGYTWDVKYDTNMWVCLAWLATQTIAIPVGKMGVDQGKQGISVHFRAISGVFSPTASTVNQTWQLKNPLSMEAGMRFSMAIFDDAKSFGVFIDLQILGWFWFYLCHIRVMVCHGNRFCSMTSGL